MRPAARGTGARQRLINDALRPIDRRTRAIPECISTAFASDTLLVLSTSFSLSAECSRGPYIAPQLAWLRAGPRQWLPSDRLAA